MSHLSAELEAAQDSFTGSAWKADNKIREIPSAPPPLFLLLWVSTPPCDILRKYYSCL